jgi:methyltransferase (TIGR00027 family)
MGGRKRSRTAQGVVAERAVLTGMGVLTDPYAAGMLTPSMAAIVTLLRLLPNRVCARSVTLAGLAARVAWFDDQVAQALDAGISQVVVIGAGYDSRAWRFRRDGVQFFEVDHGATQADKRRRAPGSGPGPTYVETDLVVQSAADALRAAGFAESRPAQFVIEGVTMYLDGEVLRHQLRELRTMAAPGSRLSVDFSPPTGAGTSRHRRQDRLQRLSRVGSGEGFRLQVDRAGTVDLVESCGWTVTAAVSLREAARALVGRGAGLPVDAVNEGKTLVAAVVTEA